MPDDMGNGFTNKEILLRLEETVDRGFERLEAIYTAHAKDDADKFETIGTTLNRMRGGLSALITGTFVLGALVGIFHGYL